jgi:HAD superfamily hydrolase (TIGR01549 family)
MTRSRASTPRLSPQLAAFAPALVIFDKDGTLIDFHAMWGGWLTELARRLETATGMPIADKLFKAMGFEASAGQIKPAGQLAITPMAGLRKLTLELLRGVGLSPQAAETAMAAAWHLSDPVALAQPLTDLKDLFSTLRAYGTRVAIATSDDRTATETMLAALNLAPLVDALVCADDGVPIKPAPDMVLSICGQLDIPPARTVVVGDNPDDLRMGHAAGAGLVIGVLSGVSSADNLALEADILLPNVEKLLQP